jgi:hypothetical protein
VLPRILGDAGIGQQLPQQIGIPDRPRRLAQDVDQHRPGGRVQDRFLGRPPPRCRVEHQFGGIHRPKLTGIEYECTFEQLMAAIESAYRNRPKYMQWSE